jgi:deazaflavin-dependent oxidoreductase (nitroreductase family)
VRRLFRTIVPVALYRLTGGRLFGRIGGQAVLLLSTTGRRSGRPRTTPVQYLRDGDAFVVVASNAGARKPPAWLFNLRAEPGARVQVGRETLNVTARETAGAERVALWRRLASANPALARAAQRAGRELPVVVLAQDARPATGRASAEGS